MEYEEMKTCEFCGGNLYIDWSDPGTVRCDTCGFTIEYPVIFTDHNNPDRRGEDYPHNQHKESRARQ